jgi:hypothetical protein
MASVLQMPVMLAIVSFHSTMQAALSTKKTGIPDCEMIFSCSAATNWQSWRTFFAAVTSCPTKVTDEEPSTKLEVLALRSRSTTNALHVPSKRPEPGRFSRNCTSTASLEVFPPFDVTSCINLLMVSKDFAVTSGCQKKRINTFSKVSALVHLLDRVAREYF